MTPLTKCVSAAVEVKDSELWISQAAVLIKGISHVRFMSVYKMTTQAEASFVTGQIYIQ